MQHSAAAAPRQPVLAREAPSQLGLMSVISEFEAKHARLSCYAARLEDLVARMRGPVPRDGSIAGKPIDDPCLPLMNALEESCRTYSCLLDRFESSLERLEREA